MNRRLLHWSFAPLLAALAACASAPTTPVVGPAGLPIAVPEQVGMASSELARIGPAVDELLDAGRTAGVMTMVARRGRVAHWEARGWRVLGEDPLERDDIFRIYSMTKPVTSVAVMMLVEEGLLSLDTRLSDVIPAFRGTRVYEDGRRRPASTPITIRHLLTHTSGLGYGDIGGTPVDSLYRAQQLGVWGTAGDLRETVSRIASLPLAFDPGTRWNYSLSVDVLGRVVEIVSGQSLDAFFDEHIFTPLGMEDTGFYVPAEKLDRFVGVYGPGPDGLRLVDSPVDGQHTRPAEWLSGGGGLTSTANDYVRFAQMLLNEGELDGIRILDSETVRLMTRNHLPDELVPIPIGGQNQGFGLGFAVSMGENEGAYRWLGIAGTYFWIDPAEELVVLAWNQLQPLSGAPLDRVMADIVYDAIEDRGETSASGPLIFQPGAPGQAGRALSAGDVAALDRPEHTAADVRFMRGMIPHHAQALRMTHLVRAHAESDAVRGMARRMEISQLDEIALMEAWLEARGETVPNFAPTDPLPMMPGMLSEEQMEELESARGEAFDRLFLELMIQHHEGALAMVRELFTTSGAGQESETYQFASEVEVDQTIEIERMQSLLEEMGTR